jgi:4-hydroxythreonine-4-phosphate dehydrogenase
MGPLGITIGDAAGIGPELILCHGGALRDQHPVVVYGSEEVFVEAFRDLSARGIAVDFDRVVSVDNASAAARTDPTSLPVIDVLARPARTSLRPYPWGEAVPWFGSLEHASLLAAVDAAMRDEICAVFTAPWHKARLADAGLTPTGHTEVLEAQSGADKAVMLLAGDRLRVALATIHLPLRDVPAALTTESIETTGRILAAGLRERYGIESPTIAVCGLNPHAGESGVLGHEDEEVVAPAIEALRASGIDASGPYPADTLFPRLVAGRQHADAVLAMYHDQGLVPLKTVHFGESANITLGLPFVRTSVDHGTAYDIAGSGEADSGSFLYAGRLALEMAERHYGS